MDDGQLPGDWSGWTLLGIAATIGAFAHHGAEFIARMVGWRDAQNSRFRKAIKDEIVNELKAIIGEAIGREFSAIRQQQAAVQLGIDGKLTVLEAKINHNRQDIDVNHNLFRDLQVEIADKLGRVESAVDILLERSGKRPQRRD